MVHLYRAAKAHPLVAIPLAALGSIGGLYFLAAEFWGTVNVDKPFLKALLEAVGPALSLGTLWVLLLLLVTTVSLSVIVAVGVGAVQNKREVERLTNETTRQAKKIEDLETERGGLLATKAELADQRDLAKAALSDKKRELGTWYLRQCGAIQFKDKPKVKIRFAKYGGDDRIAVRMKSLIDEYVHWDVTLDGSNNPALPQAGKVKVFIEYAPFPYFDPFMWGFLEGDFLGVSVGGEPSRTEDLGTVLVTVFPSST